MLSNRAINRAICLSATNSNYVLPRHEQLIIPRAYPQLVVFLYDISIDQKNKQEKNEINWLASHDADGIQTTHTPTVLRGILETLDYLV